MSASSSSFLEHSDVSIEDAIDNALESRIYFRNLIDSLYAAVMETPSSNYTSKDLLQKYDTFLEFLRTEIADWGVEKVLIGIAPNVTGCKITTIIEITHEGIFMCKDEKTEAARLSDVLVDLYSPKDIIENVIRAITRQRNKSRIDMLESDIKAVKDLISDRYNKSKQSDESSPDATNIDECISQQKYEKT